MYQIKEEMDPLKQEIYPVKHEVYHVKEEGGATKVLPSIAQYQVSPIISQSLHNQPTNPASNQTMHHHSSNHIKEEQNMDINFKVLNLLLLFNVFFVMTQKHFYFLTFSLLHEQFF